MLQLESETAKTTYASNVPHFQALDNFSLLQVSYLLRTGVDRVARYLVARVISDLR